MSKIANEHRDVVDAFACVSADIAAVPSEADWRVTNDIRCPPVIPQDQLEQDQAARGRSAHGKGHRVMKIFAIVITLLLLGAQAPTATANSNTMAQIAAAPPPPKQVNDILYAQPFTLAKGYINSWSKERAVVSSGVLVVLVVDPVLVEPRDALEPILYAGNTPVQRLNHGYQSGRVIGIVPGATDLTGSPIWFGAPGLPERVTAETTRTELARAEKTGIRPFPVDKLRSVTHAPAAAADLAALLRDIAATLVFEYSPQEKDIADAWRLPIAKEPPKQRR